MPSIFDKFVRVTYQSPCPVCGRGDWCLVSKDGRRCVSKRVKSGKAYGEAGWLHYIPESRRRRVMTTGEKKIYLAPDAVRKYVRLVTSPQEARGMLKVHAHKLGVSLRSLTTFRAGYD